MQRPLFAIAFLALPACVVYSHDSAPEPVNRAPIVTWAEAGCTWDPAAYDWVWWFDAEVTDPDGLLDLTDVFADVIDDWDGTLVDSFLLDDFGDGFYSTEWLQYDTWLDCRSGPYLVEFVAYDIFDAYDVYAVYPYQE